MAMVVMLLMAKRIRSMHNLLLLHFKLLCQHGILFHSPVLSQKFLGISFIALDLLFRLLCLLFLQLKRGRPISLRLSSSTLVLVLLLFIAIVGRRLKALTHLFLLLLRLTLHIIVIGSLLIWHSFCLLLLLLLLLIIGFTPCLSHLICLL